MARELFFVVGWAVETELEEDDDFRLATRCAVVGGKADICIGGRATGSALFGCADDNVYKEQ